MRPSSKADPFSWGHVLEVSNWLLTLSNHYWKFALTAINELRWSLPTTFPVALVKFGHVFQLQFAQPFSKFKNINFRKVDRLNGSATWNVFLFLRKPGENDVTEMMENSSRSNRWRRFSEDTGSILLRTSTKGTILQSLGCGELNLKKRLLAKDI
jgi:hypothetical protein